MARKCLFVVAHLAESHLVVISGYVIIPGLAAMGIVAGGTAKFPPLTAFRQVGFAGKGVTRPVHRAVTWTVLPTIS